MKSIEKHDDHWITPVGLLRQDLTTTGIIEGEDLERVGLGVESILHEINWVVRLHQEVEVLEGLAGKEGLHVVLRLAPRVLPRKGEGEGLLRHV